MKADVLKVVMRQKIINMNIEVFAIMNALRQVSKEMKMIIFVK